MVFRVGTRRGNGMAMSSSNPKCRGIPQKHLQLFEGITVQIKPLSQQFHLSEANPCIWLKPTDRS